MSKVLFDNVSKVYDGGVVAVNGIDLSVADEEFMVIVGPSGCGKTTTLRMVAGLEDITSGTISIDGRVVNDVLPKDRDIAMVFQNYALYPHMTVFQNMSFGLKLRKFSKPEIAKRVSLSAAMLGIEHLLHRKPKALSGGQRQRVALGRAIVRNPKAFLFDEPLSNLDAKLRVTTRSELKALHRRLKTTTIYVTHDQVEAMTLGDRICVMYNGEVQQVASPMEVYDSPANKFVAGFLGTPSMNFFEGEVVFSHDKPRFVISGGTEISLLDSLKTKLAMYDGRSMVLGVRPEHISPDFSNSQVGNAMPSVVDIVEPLGDRMDVYLTSRCGQKFISNIDSHVKLVIDGSVLMAVDITKVHIFEPSDTGRNVVLEGKS